MVQCVVRKIDINKDREEDPAMKVTVDRLCAGINKAMDRTVTLNNKQISVLFASLFGWRERGLNVFCFDFQVDCTVYTLKLSCPKDCFIVHYFQLSLAQRIFSSFYCKVV